MNWFRKMPLPVKVSIGFLFTVWLFMLISVPELTLSVSIVTGTCVSIGIILYYLTH